MKLQDHVKHNILAKLQAGEITATQALDALAQFGITIKLPGGATKTTTGKVKVISRSPRLAKSMRGLDHVPAGWGWREQV